MKKTILILLFVIITLPKIFGESFEQVTILGFKGNLQLEKLSLTVNHFTKSEILEMPKETTLKICESIDNSKLVIFGAQFSAKEFQSVFDQAPINNALTNLLKRGGCIFFGPSSWDIISGFPRSMKLFFKACNATLITNELYKIPSKDKEIILRGVVSEEYTGERFGNPEQAKLDLQASRHFGDISKTKFKVLVKSTPDNFPIMVMEENVLGQGTVIFTYVHNLFQSTEHPFTTSLVKFLYGEREKKSSKALIRAKLPNSNVTAPANITLLELSKAPTVSFYNYRQNKSPTKSTAAKVELKNHDLIIDFRCQEPDPSKIKSMTTIHDGDVWNDDCVELIIADSDKPNANIFHYIVNSQGVCYDAKNNNVGWNPKYSVRTSIQDTYWGVQLVIPLDILGFDESKLKSFKINLAREETQHKEISSWSSSLFQLNEPQSLGYASILTREEFIKQLSNARTNTVAGQVTIWQAPMFTKVFNDTFPSASTIDLKQANILVARNEKESTNILISNTTDDNIYFRIEPQPKLTRSMIKYKQMFTLKEAIPWRDTAGNVFSESLVALNEANIIAVPALETRMLWVDVKTDLPAGDYLWSLSLIPVNIDIPKKTVDIKVKVLPLRFPDSLPISVYTFGPYIMTWAAQSPELREAYWRTCLDYHINTIQSCRARK